MKVKLKEIANKMLDVIFPVDIKCLLCGKELKNNDIFCSDCLDSDIFNEGTRCIYCDAMIKEGNLVCNFCREKHHIFEKCFCPLNYNGSVRKAILSFKEDNARYLAKPFAKLIFQRLKQENLQIDFIVPVPSHISSIKKRGYNPAYLLAEEVSKITNIPLYEALIKNAKTPNQKFLDYEERYLNIQYTMKVVGNNVKGKSILIIDDVITTCATVDACATLLSNAKHIYACAVARTNLM